ncbi:MAG: hypothetical protein IKO25_06190 [Clostridia bacterium]|nr:hypothetical protein [Clostridia bacterium]
MTTDEIIRELRAKAGVEGKSTLAGLLHQAADRLEELDERVAIMMEGNRVEIVMEGKNILDLYSTQITKVLEK